MPKELRLVPKKSLPASVGRLTNKNEAQLSCKNKDAYFESYRFQHPAHSYCYQSKWLHVLQDDYHKQILFFFVSRGLTIGLCVSVSQPGLHITA